MIAVMDWRKGRKSQAAEGKNEAFRTLWLVGGLLMSSARA